MWEFNYKFINFWGVVKKPTVEKGMKIYLYRNGLVGKVSRTRCWGWPILNGNKVSVISVLLNDWSGWENSLEYKDFGKWEKH